MSAYINPLTYQDSPDRMLSTDPKRAALGTRQNIGYTGQQLMNAAGQQADQAGGQAQSYLNATDPLEQQMIAGQGGYTPQESAAITGDTGSYTKYFDPVSANQTLTKSQDNQNNAVGQLNAGLYNAVGNPGTQAELRQNQDVGTSMQNTLNSEGKNLTGAVTNEASQLNSAVDPSKLGLSQDFTNNYLMSPTEQQNIVTGAGISAGNKDSQAVGDLQRSAAAAGTDPMGVAAYRQRMATQQAADAGDAMTQARIQASNAAAGRQQTNEAMREQTQQDISSRQMQNAQTVANTGIGAQETGAEQQLNTTMGLEQNRQNALQYLTGANLQAATTGGEATLQNAQTTTGQTQQQGQYNTSQGTNIAENQDVTNSNRAQQIAGTRIGQQNVGLQNQNQKFSTFNNNQQGAYGRQLGAYGTQTSGETSTLGTQQDASQNPSTFDKVAGAVGGALSFLDAGGVVDQPTLATVGEQGPEAVVPLGGATPQTPQTPGFFSKLRQQAQPIAQAVGNTARPGATATPNTPYQMAGAAAGAALNGILQRRRNAQNNAAMGPVLAQDATQSGYTPPPPDLNYAPPANQSPMNKGSIVTKPTVAMLGDKGPEAVIPLDGRKDARVRPSILTQRRPYGQAA